MPGDTHPGPAGLAALRDAITERAAAGLTHVQALLDSGHITGPAADAITILSGTLTDTIAGMSALTNRLQDPLAIHDAADLGQLAAALTARLTPAQRLALATGLIASTGLTET